MPAEVENMFSVKERPWHGLGTVLEEAPSIEEGIKLAGLDWDVSLRSIETDDDDRIKLDTHKIIIREDNQKPLGIVSSKYKMLQNKEAFNFFEPFLENDMASLETAGSLFGGKKVFILAKINSKDMEIQKDDVVEKYILLSNSHDGSQALRIGFCPIRVVCNNTLSAAIEHKDSQLIRLTHRGNIVSTLNEVRETMDVINQQFRATEEQYKYLATREVNKYDLQRYVKQVFSVKKLEQIITDYEQKQEAESEKIEKYRQKLIARATEIFDNEKEHNAWTMYNAVNWQLNHDRGKTLEHRYNGIWFGDSKRLDNKALQLALTY